MTAIGSLRTFNSIQSRRPFNFAQTNLNYCQYYYYYYYFASYCSPFSVINTYSEPTAFIYHWQCSVIQSLDSESTPYQFPRNWRSLNSSSIAPWRGSLKTIHEAITRKRMKHSMRPNYSHSGSRSPIYTAMSIWSRSKTNPCIQNYAY